jgi:hypothetical protein
VRERAGAVGLASPWWTHHYAGVIRHLASRPERRIGSLFFNPGGPGDSGVAAVAERGESLDTLTRGRIDIVGWDIRGTAGSAPVMCFADAAERASCSPTSPPPTRPGTSTTCAGWWGTGGSAISGSPSTP